MENNKKKKIKETVRKLKEAKEKLGEKKIKNVDRPGKIKPSKKEDKKKDGSGSKKDAPSVTGVGPRGGTYKVTASGKKQYQSRGERVKKSMEEYFKHLEIIDRFINKYKEFKGLM